MKIRRGIHGLLAGLLSLCLMGGGNAPGRTGDAAFDSLYLAVVEAIDRETLPRRILLQAVDLNKTQTIALAAADDSIAIAKRNTLVSPADSAKLEELVQAVIRRETLRSAGLDSLRCLAGLLKPDSLLSAPESTIRILWDPEDLSDTPEFD